MKLAVFSGQYFWFDGKYYSTDEAFAKFVTSFSRYFDKIVFCDVVIRGQERRPYVLDGERIEVCPLPYFSVYSFVKNTLVTFPKIHRLLKDKIRDWDVVWLPAPHPVSLLFANICHGQGKPFFQLVRQNLMEQVRHRNRGIRKFWAMAVVATLEYVSRRVARRHLTFTVGREMYDAYRRGGRVVHEIAVSLVSERDIDNTFRTKTLELHEPVRLLSVGRLDPEKGLAILIAAVEELVRKRRRDVVLWIVGKGLKGMEEWRLRQAVESRHLTNRVRFLGYVPHGEGLFSIYRESDIFVLPSLTGEGIPQTLFEAMACGIPVIATKVAGIPSAIVNGKSGLLISSGSPGQICDAVERLIGNAELRKSLIRRGFHTARKHTLDAERDRMITRIEAWLEESLQRNDAVTDGGGVLTE